MVDFCLILKPPSAMSFNISLHQQLDAFTKDGTILSPDGNINEAGYWNFNNWLCETSSLETKAKSLMRIAKQFADEHPELNREKHYVRFKNNLASDQSVIDEIEIADEKKAIVSFRPLAQSIKKAAKQANA